MHKKNYSLFNRLVVDSKQYVESAELNPCKVLNLKRFLICFLFGLQVTYTVAQRTTYIAPHFGVTRFTGEIEFNQFFYWSPIGPMSRPNAGFILGTRFDKSLSIELNTDMIFYGGDSRYSDPIVNPIGTIKGNSIILGFAIDKKFINGYDLGVGLNYGLNNFSEKPVSQNDWSSYRTQNNSIMFRLSKCVKQFKNGNEMLFRYSIVYNLKDNWDNYQSGSFNDLLSLGQIVFYIPSQNLKPNNHMGSRGNRSKHACAEF